MARIVCGGRPKTTKLGRLTIGTRKVGRHGGPLESSAGKCVDVVESQTASGMPGTAFCAINRFYLQANGMSKVDKQLSYMHSLA